MDVVGISEATASTATESTFNTGSSSMDKEDFLQLLVTQMQYQDPTSPMSNEQMAAQLAQFSSVEALNNINDTLNNSLLLEQSLNNSFMTSLIGKEIKAYGNGIEFSGDDVTIPYYLAAGSSVKVKIYDDDGNLIKTVDAGKQSSGEQTATWDGKNQDGVLVDEGTYTFKVDAVDSSGNTVSVDSFVNGEVGGIVYIEGSPYLEVNGHHINLGDVISINKLESSSDPTGGVSGVAGLYRLFGGGSQ